MDHGRGSTDNPACRFTPIAVVPDEVDGAESPAPATEFFRDRARSAITTNDSPDIGFDASLNPYRGCEHGCAYCYARPTHEYLGLSAGLDFETRILVKEDAPALLRRELLAPTWKPQVLALSGVTDAYQPVERQLRLTRGCLEVLADFRNPVAVVTKNHLVTRDAGHLAELARHRAALVHVSITTLDAGLAGSLEPRASRPAKRLEAIERLTAAGVPTGVMVAPVVPGLNDHEIPAIVAAAAAAGARFASKTLLRLPHGLPQLFGDWLARHEPLRRDKVLAQIRGARGGRLDDPRFGWRMRGEGPLVEQIDRMFEVACRRAGLRGAPELSTAAFRRPGGSQLGLFAPAESSAGRD